MGGGKRRREGGSEMNGQTGRWGEMHRWRGEGEPVPALLSSCTPCRCTPPQRQRLWCLGRGEVIPLLRHPIVPRPDLFVPPHRAIMRNPSPRLTSGRTGEDITSHFHHGTSRLSRKQRGEQAGQAESLPAAGCSNAPLPSCMAWMASGNNAYLLLRLHQLARLFLHHFSLQLMVAQAGPDRRRELPRSCLTAPLASIKPVCPPRRLCFPRFFSTLDTTSHFQERQISLVLTTATLDWRASEAEQEEGWCDTRLFLILFSLVQIGTLTRAFWPPIRLEVGSRPVTGPDHLLLPYNQHSLDRLEPEAPAEWLPAPATCSPVVQSTMAGGAAAARQVGPGTAAIQMPVAVD